MGRSEMNKQDAEKVLGLTGTYTKQEVRATYRKLSMSYHPDHAASSGLDDDDATAKMQDINEAYQRIMQAFSSNGTDTLAAEPASYGEWLAAEERKRAAAVAEEYRRQQEREKMFRDLEYAWQEIPPQEQARRTRKWSSQYDEDSSSPPDPAGEPGEEEDGPESPVEDGTEEETPCDTASTGEVPRWLRVAKAIATFFPYRTALLVGVIFAMNAVVGIDFFGGPMGLAPNRDADALLILVFPVLFFASLANMLFPFMTGPIRTGILNAIKNAEEEAKRQSS